MSVRKELATWNLNVGASYDVTALDTVSLADGIDTDPVAARKAPKGIAFLDLSLIHI